MGEIPAEKTVEAMLCFWLLGGSMILNHKLQLQIGKALTHS